YAELQEYTDLMQHIAQAYRSLPSASESAIRLREIFILMSRHLLDQGWQDNSALYTTHHFGYASRGWYVAVFLMRDELQKAGLLDPTARSLIWYMREKVDFAKMEFDPKTGTDLDYLNTIAKSHLMTVLSMPDGPAKTALVKKYSTYFSDLLAVDTHGTLGGIKADGTAFHHGGNYPGYSFPAFRSAGTLCRLLNGTPFAVRPDALQNLNKALTAAAIYSNPETGIGLSGRHPFGESSIRSLDATFQDLEVCGQPVELDLNHMPDGHWSFNYGCFGIHRWNGKMVTFKGYNKYVWSSEIYTRDNRYGRYQSHGGVQIMNPQGRAASGWVQDGWDWNRNPGTTTIHLPLNLLENPKSGTLMARSDARFSGSSNLGGRYGIFAADIKTPDVKNFDPSFVARKSMFSFDNRIICLGAGIQNETSGESTETTLFQHEWKEGSTPVWMDSAQPVASMPHAQSSAGTSWLVDAHGNGYYIATGGTVHLSIAAQTSRHNKSKKPTQGDFASAWIDHGKAPRDASYEYAILLDGTPDKMAAFAAAPTYRVLRNDPQLQAVCDTESGVTGYAFFEGASEPVDDLLLYTDKPCLVMTQPDEKTSGLVMSIGNADLRIIGADSAYTTAEASRPGWVDILLNGTWELVTPNENVTLKDRDGNTFISVKIHHAIPVEFALKQ
ncbi:MAG: chondroitin lyase, partial [Verrucomicrobia bacterium]|nr:chondroitin lyase [Verrucomicrobiota bacterium]